jgi:hypothetical protein
MLSRRFGRLLRIENSRKRKNAGYGEEVRGVDN